VLLDDGAVAGCRAALERVGLGIADEREVVVIDVEDRPAALGRADPAASRGSRQRRPGLHRVHGRKIVIATDDVGSASAVLR
jgi:hypothetical protein